MSCPCGNDQPLEACCGPFIDGTEAPPTAEALMRSRYTAYTLENVDYIVTTHDPESADEVDRDATAEWAEQAEWLGLDVVETKAGGEADDTGEVEFVARFSIEGNEYAHHERSEFKKRDGRWYYHAGEMIKRQPVRRDQPKVGRNEPCPCGSGKKFKRCHGAS